MPDLRPPRFSIRAFAGVVVYALASGTSLVAAGGIALVTSHSDIELDNGCVRELLVA